MNVRGQPGRLAVAIACLTAAGTSSDRMVRIVLPAIRIDRVVGQIFGPVVVGAEHVEPLLVGAGPVGAAFAVASYVPELG